jgi:hypothetical protein
MERELVKIASDNPAYPQGYYTQFKDRMKPGDIIFGETNPVIPDAKAAEDAVPAPEKAANRKKVKK